MIKSEMYIIKFSESDEDLDIFYDSCDILEKHVPEIYGKTDESTNQRWCKLYSSTHGRFEATNIP